MKTSAIESFLGRIKATAFQYENKSLKSHKEI